MVKVFDDIKLLVVKSPDGYGLNDVKIDMLKSNIELIIDLNVEDVFIVVDHDMIEKYSKEELTSFTHILSDTIDFPHYTTLTIELMIPVVTSVWLETIIKNKKIEALRCYSPNPRHIFKKFVVTTDNNMTEDDKNIMKTAVKVFGGVYVDELKRTITHLITDDLTTENSKLVTASNQLSSTNTIHIIKPSWIINSILVGKILPEKDYLVNNKTENIVESIPGYLSSFKFEFSSTLKLSSLVENAFDFLSHFSGNKIVHLTKCVDISIDENEKQRTFNYLFSLMFQQTDELIKDSLLFHPFKIGGIDGMRNIRASATNYTGDSRGYIEELITRMGGTFTKCLKSSNTHLIASKLIGKKCNFANLWGCKIVSHCWVEDCYTNWKILETEEYTQLPREVGNIRSIDHIDFDGFQYKNPRASQGENINHKEDHPNDEDMIGTTSDTKLIEVPVEEKDGTIIGNEKVKKDASFNEDRSQKQVISDTTNSAINSKAIIPKNNKKKTKEQVAKTDHLKENKAPTESKKENDRKTKNNVNSKLESDTNSDINSNLEVWEIPDEQEIGKVPSKRRATAIKLDSGSPPTKKVAKISNKPYEITAIATGLDYSLSNSDKKELKKIGINIADSPNKKTNCIIAPSLLRTQKFLTALSFDPVYFLDPQFLNDVLGTLDSCKKVADFEAIQPNIEDYDIWKNINYTKDIVPKKLFSKGTSKAQAISYMKKKRSNLFNGLRFNLSPGLTGGFDTLSKILKSYGCSGCYPFKASNKKVEYSDRGMINDIEEEVALLICDPKEKKIIELFTKICEKDKLLYVIIEWDEIVCDIFEAQFKIRREKVLLQNIFNQ